jgi:cystathionine gamma-synthase
LPTWNSILGYELGDSAIVSRMKMGYPRFFLHPKVVELFNTVNKPDGYTDTLLFLNAGAATAAREYLSSNGQKVLSDMIMINEYKFFGVFFNQKAIAKEFWQHTGLGISSRFAEAVLTAKDCKTLVKNDAVVKQVLKKRIASYLDSDHVYLFSSGMIYKLIKRDDCHLSGFKAGLEAFSGSENGAVWISICRYAKLAG